MNFRLMIIQGLFCVAFFPAAGQVVTQTVKGKVVDRETQVSLPGANVVVMGTNPLLGSSTDINGDFSIKNVPVGRYTVKMSFIGYEELIMNEVLVGSGKEVVLNAGLKENAVSMKGVVIRADKGDPINALATVSARQLSVEEANRYAGGFDDPARLASSFAGVSSNLGSNGIVIRGNAPKGLLWRMEGVEINNPSHFANIISVGAGGITALSSQVLANSDFITGAFPAEYGNALSGVFDIRLRTGNSDKREYTLQAGVIGMDVSSEGPLIKGGKASYLFNYRYSTFALIAPILPPEMGKLKYQDLSFKLNFPTANAGTFSLWGIGALDYQGRDAKKDSAKWKLDIDKQSYRTDLFMSALGLNHKWTSGNRTFISTSLAASGNGLSLLQKSYHSAGVLFPTNKIDNNSWKYSLSGFINHKFSPLHTNKTGFILDRLQYNLDIQKAPVGQDNLLTYVMDHGSSYLLQVYSQSTLRMTGKLTANLGLHTQYFVLNRNTSLEPRIGLSWKLNPSRTIALSYGLHSQLEMLNFYLVRQQSAAGTTEPNKNLDFSKAHHVVLSYEVKLNSQTRLKIEPYYQMLFSIPVIPNTYYSLQNLESGMYFNDSLINKGKGRNIGVDFTVERFLNQGYYYLFTASLFDSKYRGGDGIERNARFNKNYVVNLLVGKEWNTGRNNNNIFNINGKLCLMGGDYMNPVDITATYAAQDIVEDVSRAFTQRKPGACILSFSTTYRVNKPKYAGIWAFNFINVLGYKELNGYYFDKMTQTVKSDINQLVIPNLSYKIEF
ncbi:MAG: carboxypeptidase-like regulatory domain-containing protein [Bacteroidetes bacterium]|nr:carboxypeptidase-like regulatory domain-containing protein [Bacteroidota bacterium]